MSTKINNGNYALFILDYYEGCLNAHDRAELMNYLIINDEARRVFEDYEHVTLHPETSLKFSNKESLKKMHLLPFGLINELNYPEFFFDDIEGNLTPEESGQLKQFLILNPSLEKEYHLFVLSRLIPDENIVYDGKSNLKKTAVLTFRKPNIRRFAYAAAVSAIFVLIAAGAYLFNLIYSENNVVQGLFSANLKNSVNRNVKNTGIATGNHLNSSQSVKQIIGAASKSENQNPSLTIRSDYELRKLNKLQLISPLNVSNSGNEQAFSAPIQQGSTEFTDAMNYQSLRISMMDKNMQNSEQKSLVEYGFSQVKKAVQPESNAEEKFTI